MATDAPTTATRPVRKRATPPAAKSAPAAPKPVSPAPVGVGDDGLARYPFQCESAGDTKSYAKFVPPASSGCVGTLYVPLGTQEVKVLLIGPATE